MIPSIKPFAHNRYAGNLTEFAVFGDLICRKPVTIDLKVSGKDEHKDVLRCDSLQIRCSIADFVGTF
jgi:hypothetical protein